MESRSSVFDELGTIGVEEEFYVVDGNGYPTAGTDELVYESDPPGPLTDRLDHELFKCVIETQTPIADTLAEAREHVTAVRETLVEYAADHGYQIAAAGLHPAARWRELEHAEKPRYANQLDRLQYPQHRNLTAGVHVHIGVDDPDKAVWICNELREHVPPILALAANSPYWNGTDTGLASARGLIFEGLPNTGIPTAFEDFEAYHDLEQTLIETDSVRDRGEIWYDVRPHTEHGTVEFRAPDAQRDPERVLALIEYVHALVMDLAERYEDGESGTTWRREILDQNKWRAIRYGHDATFITQDGSVRDFEAIMDREVDRLGTTALRTLQTGTSGAMFQRSVYDRAGMDGLCEELTL